MHIEAFMEDHMVLVVPSSHEWAGRKITLDELRSQPLLTREFGSGSRRIVEQALAAAGLKTKELSLRMELDSTEGLLNAVEAGLGVTFVSRWAVRNQLALGTLKLARVDGLKLLATLLTGLPSWSGAFRQRGCLPQISAGPRCGGFAETCHQENRSWAPSRSRPQQLLLRVAYS